MSIAEPLLSPHPEVLSPHDDGAAALRRDPVPQRGREHRALRRLGPHHAWPSTASTARSSSPTTTPTTTARRWRSAAGARVVHERRRGYGNAYMAGFGAARGRYILMADADLTYDFGEIPRFLAELEAGADLVMGDRMDGIEPGAMPWLHRYIGNPVLSRHAQPLLPHRRARRPLRHARLPPRRAARARAAHDRHGVRVRDGDPGGQGQARDPPAADHLPPARRRRRSSRASATAGATCASCSSTRRRTCSPLPGALLLLAGVLVGLVSLSGIELLGREWQLHSMIAGSLLADRRHPGARPRALRPRLRPLLHGGARGVVRPHARPLPPRARPRPRRRDPRSAGS